MTGAFNKYSKYYDLIYSYKDTPAEVSYLIDLLGRFGVTGGSLLEFGSGTGRHARLLSEKGFEVDGIEQSPEMISRCMPHERCIFQQGDIASFKTGKKYNAVLSLFHVISYQQTNSRINQVFQNASNHLDKDGLFVFDVWYTPAVLTISPTVRVKKLRSDDFDLVRVAEPTMRTEENIVDVSYTIFARSSETSSYTSFNEVHSMRYFSIPELHFFAELNGFKLLCSEEWMTRKPPSPQAWGVCIVLQKV